MNTEAFCAKHNIGNIYEVLKDYKSQTKRQFPIVRGFLTEHFLKWFNATYGEQINCQL